MSQEPSTPAKGERRRRRERERARQQGQGGEQPMSRRERRALEEALATGEVELTTDGQYAPTGELPVTTTGQHVLADPDAQPQGTQEAAAQPEPEPGPEPEPEREPEPEPEPEPEAAPEPEQPARVTRRSLRERRTNAPPPPQPPESTEHPAERTATGRRPVIRPPAGARSTRSVDATGELTSIQRAVRDVDAPAGQETSTWNVTASQFDAPSPESQEPSASAEAATAGATEDPEEDEAPEEEGTDVVDDRFDMQPRWERVDSVTAPAQAAETEEPQESSQPGAQDGDSEPEEPDEERHTPRLLKALYWLVLVLAGVVLGLLVWRMASGDLFGSDDALALAGRLTGAAPAWLPFQ